MSAEGTRKYRLSARGRAKEKAWRQSPKGKASTRRFQTSVRGKEISKRQCEKYIRTPHGKYITARKEARRRHPWEITENEYTKLMENSCFYCDGSLPVHGTGLDRIDSSKGYSPDNVLPCCGTCNKVKGNWWTVEETRCAVQAVIALRQSRKDDNNILSVN